MYPTCNIEVNGDVSPQYEGEGAKSLTQPSQQSYQQHLPRTYSQPPLGPLPQKGKSALIISIISLIILFISGAIGWWSISIEYEIEDTDYEDSDNKRIQELNMDFTFEEVSYETKTTLEGETDSYDDDADLIGDLEDVGKTTGLLFTIGMVMTLIVIILIGILMAIIISRNVGLSMFTKLFKNLTFLFSLLAVITITIAPIYYMIAWPMTLEDQLGDAPVEVGVEIYDGSFLGSKEIEFEEMGHTYRGDSNWGPGPGWILAIICIILLWTTMILVRSAGEEAMSLAPPPQPRPWPQYVPQPPPPYQKPPSR